MATEEYKQAIKQLVQDYLELKKDFETDKFGEAIKFRDYFEYYFQYLSNYDSISLDLEDDDDENLE